MAEEQRHDHYYGGQAVIEGVMMRGLDRAAIAVRRQDGRIVLTERDLGRFGQPRGPLGWPFIRGNVMLVETLLFGMSALQFSADVLTAEERERLAAEGAPADQAAEPPKAGLSHLLTGLSTLVAFVFGLGLFILLPTWLIGLLPGLGAATPTGPASGLVMSGSALLKNVVEGGLRLVIIVLYILAISLMKYVGRVFEYHGAEHATINCYESGEPVTVENCLRFSPLHPRCGTAFLLVVILVKIVVGWFFGWPTLGLRIAIRLGLLPLVAAVAYEIIRWAGRHRQSLLSRMLAWPGLMLQKLTTRHPDAQQVETAIMALSALAPGVERPAGAPEPILVDAKLNPVT